MIHPFKELKARIKGRVQGVGFRFFVRSKARVLGLKGYVRNLPDGTVEVSAVGPETILRDFVEELKKGPPASQVRSCQVEWCEAAQVPADFSIL